MEKSEKNSIFICIYAKKAVPLQSFFDKYCNLLEKLSLREGIKNA